MASQIISRFGRQAASAANLLGRLVLPMTVGALLCPRIPARGRENATGFRRCRDTRRRLVPIFAWFALLAVFPANTTAQDTGAVGSGDWSNPATWTNGVPGAGDNAYIGSNYPTGSIANATVTLSQNSSADGVYLGYRYGNSGTLDLGGFTLTAGSLFLGGYGVGGVGAIQRTGGGTLSVSDRITVSAGSLSLAASDTASSIYTLGPGPTVTTSATGNVTGSVYVDQSCTLNLGANLMLSSELDMYGTLNANGYNISAPTVNLGDPTYAVVNNLGTITATTLSVFTSTFNLTATDNVTNLYLDGVTSTFQTGASVQTLGTIGNTIATISATGNATANVYVYGGSTLNLEAGLALSSQLDLQGTLNANGYGINAPNVYLGKNGGPATLNNRGPIFSANLVVSSANSPALATFNLTGADSVANFTLYDVSTTFPPNVTILNLSLNTVSTGSTATMSSSGNIANSAVVGPGSTLNLGADLNMYSYLDVQGTFNANGHAVSVSNSAIYLGYNGGPAVVNSNRGVFTTPYLFVSSQTSPALDTFNLIPGDNVTNVELYGVGTTIPSGASVQNLYLYSSGSGRNPTYSTASTSTNANVTGSVYLDPGNTLNLGADLIISGNADVRGTINANGHAITVQTFYVGYNAGPATINNLGRVSANDYYQGNGTQVAMPVPGSSANTTKLTGNSVLIVDDAPGQTTGFMLTGPNVGDLFIEPDSVLDLQINGLASGWAFRWADPVGGDHIADLQSLINAGEINFSYLNGGSYTLAADSSYTYINVISVPEPSSLFLAGVVGLASLGRLDSEKVAMKQSHRLRPPGRICTNVRRDSEKPKRNVDLSERNRRVANGTRTRDPQIHNLGDTFPAVDALPWAEEQFAEADRG